MVLKDQNGRLKRLLVDVELDDFERGRLGKLVGPLRNRSSNMRAASLTSQGAGLAVFFASIAHTVV